MMQERSPVKIAACSRRFPPDFKRIWFIVRYKEQFLIRCRGKRLGVKYGTLQDALDAAIQTIYEEQQLPNGL